MIKVKLTKNNEKPFVKEFVTVFRAKRFITKWSNQCIAENADFKIDFLW